MINFHSDNNVYGASWDFGYKDYFTPSTSNSFDPVYSYDKPGTYTVTYIANSYCGIDTIYKTITIGAGAVPTLKATDIMVQPACPKDPVTFSVLNNYFSYLWDFGDGFSSNEVQPQHIYSTLVPKIYTAKLTVTNNCGGSAFINFPVQIMDGLPADANFDYQSAIGYDKCPGTPIKFNPYGSGSSFWDFGDGSTSNERYPVHQFSKSNTYTVSLTVTNGCLISSTQSNIVSIYTGESWVPVPNFTFDSKVNSPVGQRDTLFICPGETVGFINQTYSDAGVTYVWDFGDGKTFYGYNATHVFPDTGIFAVTLKASNLCGAWQTSVKYVKVDNFTQPDVLLNSIPSAICAGDKVYFFDDNFDLKNNYTYSVAFGDGNTAVNIKDNTDLNIRTLVSHIYAGTGAFNYTFKATNVCGNSSVLNGTITVDNDASRKPFLYIENSTDDGSNKPPADWSVRHDPSDYEVDVPVSWASWIPAYGNDFHLFMWYGMFDPSGASMMGQPDGFVHFKTDTIIIGTKVKAYIPVSQLDPPSIGIAAGYYCGGIPRFNDKPEAFGGVVDSMFMPVQSLPIIPSGVTDLSDLKMAISIDPTWNGICSSAKIDGSWYKFVEPGVFAQLSLFDNGFGSLSYELKYTDAIVNYTRSNTIETGWYTKSNNNDTISFTNWYGCTAIGEYSIFKPGADTIIFTPFNESCPDRLPFVSGTFTKVPQFNVLNHLSVCPGDNVQFKVVGGKTYQWNFGDGNTSTLQYPLHTYAAPAVYNASVISTNSCGRKDTLYTKVTVEGKSPNNVFFWIPDYEKVAGDTVHFNYEDFSNSETVNNTYLWNFGDGSTALLKDPVHVYDLPGDYNVSLTVTNGCGPASHNELLTIRPLYRFCEAQFNYSPDGSTLYFNDISIGTPTAWSWDFGDGSYSTEQNPIQSFPKDGSYSVTLTIFNPQTNCISSVTNNIVVGSVACNSDFGFIINATNGEATFTDNSLNATDYYWDFGDGSYSVKANPMHIYAQNGIYTVCQTIMNITNGCMSSTCKDVLFMPADSAYILADFSYYNDPADSTIYLYDLSSSNTTNWYWTMGDGKMIESQNPVYTYSKPGIYDVCLIAKDKINSLSASICMKVRIGDIACATASDFSYFIDPELLKVGFSGLSSGTVDNYFWTFGDGESSTLENPDHQYLTAGYYEVSLAVRNSTDNCMDISSKYIQVGNVDCRADFSYSINPTDNSAAFYDNSKGMIEYYYWDFGDGTYSVEQNPVQVYSGPGNYLVGQFVIANLSSCADYIEQAVQVGQVDCSADFMTYIDSASYTAYFTNKNLGQSTAMLWSFGDGAFSTQENPVHEFPGQGLYSAGLNTYDFNTGCMDFYEELLLIGSLGIDCQADFVYRVDPVNGEVTFSNQSVGDIVDYVWSFGDETEAIEADPLHTYSAGGYYNVCLNVTNSAGIRNTGCKWVYIEGNTANDCRANFMYTTDSLTRTATFVDDSYGDINKYTWNFGDSSPDSASSDQNPSHLFGQKGFYLVQLKVENTLSGCVSNEYKLLNIADDQVLKAAFAYEALIPNKKFTGYPVDLVSASSGDGATVEWDFGDKQLKKGSGKFIVMDSTSRIVTHYYQLPGKYEVCVRISDPVRNISDIYCSFVYTKNAVEVEDISIPGINLNVYPNPFVNNTTINYSLEKSQFIELAVFDQLGRKVETLTESTQNAGNHQIFWETKTGTTGIFHLKMITPDGVITKALVITK
jgi:PKD repeat protein